MGVSKIKFNTGRFDRYQGNLKLDLSRLPLNEIEMNVENDQTEASGNVAPIKAFLEATGKVGFNQIGYVYDLGNWAFTGNDAIQSAKALAAYTNYIHLKKYRERSWGTENIGRSEYRDLRLEAYLE